MMHRRMIPLLAGLTLTCSTADAGQRLRLSAADDGGVDRCIRDSGQVDQFAAVRYSDDTPMPVLHDDEAKRGFVVFCRPWMDLVFPNSVPRRAEITDRLSAFATRGEHEPVVFCIRSTRDLEDLQVTVGDLVSASGARIDDAVAQIVRCVPRAWRGEEPLYESGPVGVMNIPTYLEAARPIDVATDSTVQYWLTIRVDEDARAGKYRGRIRIDHEAAEPYMIGIELEVLPITLAPSPNVLGFWDYQRPYKDEIGPIQDVYATMARYGVNGVFTRAGHYDYDKASDTYDFSRFIRIDKDGDVSVDLQGSVLQGHMDAAARAGFREVIYHDNLFECLKDWMPARHDANRFAAQSEAEVARVVAQFKEGDQYETVRSQLVAFSEKHPFVYSDAYAKLYVRIVRAVMAYAERQDWPKLVIGAWDEVFSHHHRNKIAFPFTLRHVELRNRAGAENMINHCSPFMDGEYGAYARATMPFLDIMMPGPRLSQSARNTAPYNATIPQMIAANNEHDIDTYIYSTVGTSGGVYVDLNIARYSQGFFCHSLGKGVRGQYQYIFFRPELDPYNPVDHPRLWSHERMFFFPAREEEGRLGGPGIILEGLREGTDDLRYLETLNGLIRKAKQRTDRPAAQRAADSSGTSRDRILGSFRYTDAWLDTNRRNAVSRWDKVDITPGGPAAASGHFRLDNGWSHEDYDRNRRAIANEILKLQEALTP
ncbi:MAG: hypothetical protein CMJ18_17740 [Phycisphaeraceae bacterium]|nr:hypothetical protein [Phycisphaeraceae bacterium]